MNYMIKVTTEVVDRSTIFVLTQPNIDDKHRSLVNKLGHPKTLQEISGVYFALADKDASVYPPRPGFPEARSRILPPPALILMAK
jgi:hypothetical protein